MKLTCGTSEACRGCGISILPEDLKGYFPTAVNDTLTGYEPIQLDETHEQMRARADKALEELEEDKTITNYLIAPLPLAVEKSLRQMASGVCQIFTENV